MGVQGLGSEVGGRQVGLLAVPGSVKVEALIVLAVDVRHVHGDALAAIEDGRVAQGGDGGAVAAGLVVDEDAVLTHTGTHGDAAVGVGTVAQLPVAVGAGAVHIAVGAQDGGVGLSGGQRGGDLGEVVEIGIRGGVSPVGVAEGGEDGGGGIGAAAGAQLAVTVGTPDVDLVLPVAVRGGEGSALVAAGGDGDDVGDKAALVALLTGEDLGRNAVDRGGGAGAQLAFGTTAPGIEGVVPDLGQGVGGTGGHADHIGQTAAVSGHHPAGHDAGGVGVHGAQAQLAAGIQAPSVGAAVVAQHQGVAIAGGDGHDVVHVATAVIATQADGVALALGGVVAQLAVVVAAPGVDDTGVAQGHGEVVAGGNLDNVLQAVDAAGTGVVEAVDQHRHSAVGCGGVAQLAVGVIAPGVDVALGGHGKAVVAAGGDVGDLHALGELDLDHIALADLGSVVTHTAGLKGRAVAQLAVLVVAPGPDGAVGLEGQGEVPSGGHHGHRHRLLEGQHGDEHRTGVGDTGGILAGEVDDDPAIGVRTGGLDRPGTVALALHGGDAGIGAGEGHVAGIGAQLGIAVKVKAFIAHRVHEVLAEDVAVAVPHGDGQRRLVEAVFDVLDGLGAVLAVEPGVGRLQGTVLLGAHLQGPVALAGGEITQLGGGIFAPGQGEALPVDRHAVGGAGADALGCVEIGVLRGGTIVVVAPDDRRGRQDLLDGGGGAAAGILNTQLAHVVAAPGVDTALVVHEHGELPTGTDGHNAVQVTCGLVQILVQADGAHLYGQTVAFGGAVAQLAVGVGAPGVDLGTLGHHSAVFHRRLAAQAQGEGAAHVGPDQVLEGVGGVGEVVVPIIVGGLGGETGHGLIHGEGIALV